jgi:hypothetical protein
LRSFSASLNGQDRYGLFFIKFHLSNAILKITSTNRYHVKIQPKNKHLGHWKFLVDDWIFGFFRLSHFVSNTNLFEIGQSLFRQSLLFVLNQDTAVPAEML